MPEPISQSRVVPSTPSIVALIYGGGGVGKSTLVGNAATWTWKHLGLKTRVIGADGGGTTNAIQALLERGVASYMAVDQWDERSIFETLERVCKGYWPEDSNVPNSPLLPGVLESRPCIFCGQDSGAKGLTMVSACKTCSKTFPAGTVLPVKRTPVNGLESVGLIAFEGLTSFGDLLLRRLKKLDPTGGYSISDGDFKVASPGQQHYGSAQSYLGQFVAANRSIPVPTVLWTALELRGEEDGKPLYGPKGPGKALTSTCIPWFTDVLHLDALAKRGSTGVVKDAEGVELLERKLFLGAHYPSDAPQFKFAAKTSAPQIFGMPLVISPDWTVFMAESMKAKAKSLAALDA